MNNPNPSSSADCVRCESKNRPGLYYMFNTKTGETKWCFENTDKTSPKNIISGKDVVKTPAQDRLKRLQTNIQKPKFNISKETNSSGVGKPKVPVEKKDSAANNVKYSEDTTSKQILASKVKASTSKQTKSNVASKMPLSKPTNKEGSPEPSSKRKFVISKKPHILSGSSTCVLQMAPATVKKPCDTTIKIIQPSTTSNSQKVSDKGSLPSRLLEENSISETDVNRTGNSSIGSNRRRTLGASSNSSLKKVEQRSSPSSASGSGVANTNITEKPLIPEPKPSLMSMLKGFCGKLINRTSKEKKRKLPENKDRDKMSNISLNSKPSFKPRKPDNVSVIRGVLQENDNASKKKQQSPQQLNISANARLQQLRNSLQLQQNSIPMPATSLTLRFSPEVFVVSSSQDYANVGTSDSEPMDWQPTEERVHSSSLPITRVPDSCSPSEHYETVNENLLRLAADKKRNNWKTDHYYFVVDTNVFINNPTFVDELIQMKLCDTMGTVIYVPYCVLQELDKLKTFSPSESVKTRSTRAIKFLNKCFEDKEQHIQAQSAVEEKQHLIKVTSPDDSILNCCLQVKKNVKNMLLLTEDNNLKNKALCSDILVSTKSDLISKHESRL